jgi:Ubiquitin family
MGYSTVHTIAAYVKRPLNKRQTKKMQLAVKTLTQKQISIQVEPSDTVLSLKEKLLLEEPSASETKLMTLIFQGKLSESNIDKSIHCIFV